MVVCEWVGDWVVPERLTSVFVDTRGASMSLISHGSERVGCGLNSSFVCTYVSKRDIYQFKIRGIGYDQLLWNTMIV